MLNSVGDLHFDPTVRNLLYGNTEHNTEVNIKALKVIQFFFAETGWFILMSVILNLHGCSTLIGNHFQFSVLVFLKNLCL